MAQGRKTGGKVKGSKNKRTLEREAQFQAAADALKASGVPIYDGDAHAYLMAVYKNESLPTETRMDAAKAAVRFEKPAKTENTNLGDNTRYLVALPSGEVSMDEWKAKYAPKPITEAKDRIDRALQPVTEH